MFYINNQNNQNDESQLQQDKHPWTYYAGTKEAEAEAVAKKAAEDAVLEEQKREALRQLLQQQGAEFLSEAEQEIVSKYDKLKNEELQAERAKGEVQLKEDAINRDIDVIAARLEPMYKNTTFFRREIGILEAQLREKQHELRLVRASKPHEPSQAYINAHTTGKMWMPGR